MKQTNSMVTLGLAIITMLMLGACSKTNNDSTPAAATPASTCTQSWNGQSVDQYGRPCSAAQTVCPSNGYYTSSTGQQLACTPGQMVTTNGYFPAPTSNYPYPTNPQQGCSSYLYQYGTQYVPMYLSGTLVCVNYDYLQSLLAQQPSYYDTPYSTYGVDYYYSYPPYSYSGGSSCGGTSIAISYGSFSGAACF